MDANTKADGLGIYLSGGASNYDHSASLGGVISSKRVLGMSVIYTTPIEGVKIEDASPDNTAGTGSLTIDDDGDIAYTPPGGSAGTAVTIAAGSRKLVPGSDELKYVRVFRESGKVWRGSAEFELVDMLTGVLSMLNVDDTDRSAGATHYRAVFLKAHEDVQDIRAWITTDGQSTWSLATETPAADTIQTIADEDTAPTSVSWVTATSKATAISIGHLADTDTMGLWIRRVFPAAGSVAASEQINLHLENKGA